MIYLVQFSFCFKVVDLLNDDVPLELLFLPCSTILLGDGHESLYKRVDFYTDHLDAGAHCKLRYVAL